MAFETQASNWTCIVLEFFPLYSELLVPSRVGWSASLECWGLGRRGGRQGLISASKTFTVREV